MDQRRRFEAHRIVVVFGTCIDQQLLNETAYSVFLTMPFSYLMEAPPAQSNMLYVCVEACPSMHTKKSSLYQFKLSEESCCKQRIEGCFHWVFITLSTWSQKYRRNL